MTVTETTAPTTNPVTLNEVRQHARVDAADLDDLIQDVYLPAAVDLSQKYANRSWITRTLTVTFDAYDLHNGILRLPYGPVQSITSVTWTDINGTTSTSTAGTHYYLAGDELHIYSPDAQRTLKGLAVVYVAGYGSTAASVPGAVRLAVVKLCTTLMENPEDYSTEQMFRMPYGSRALLDTVAVYA